MVSLIGSPARAQVDPSTVVIRFFDGVNERSVVELLSVVDAELAKGTKRFILLISSSGGTVLHGLAAYNYLKGIPAEVTTHNFGSTDSIALMMYCAGIRRLTVPNARFLLHGVGLTFQTNTRFEEKQLQERMNSIKTDSENIARVIATTTGKSVKEIERVIFDGTVMNADEAKAFGLASEITSTLFPAGSRVISIVPPTQKIGSTSEASERLAILAGAFELVDAANQATAREQ
jgi:ATP-dependent Clp protease protease subunit